MEHRSDLEDSLLNGLPGQERRHVIKIMEQATARKLQRLQAQVPAATSPSISQDLDREDATEEDFV